MYTLVRFWKKTVLEKLATVYKSGWIITVNDEGHWQLNFRGQVIYFYIYVLIYIYFNFLEQYLVRHFYRFQDVKISFYCLSIERYAISLIDAQCRSTRFLIGPSIRRLVGFPYLIAH
ncbi:conserved hypothetical protein [Trichinella spiralis]|uniref:hypothetical protein n=1 Tax=Trichinella spiralis TaxID=6334 RepID=UPI0001EFBBE1|nr:conserved hypothetical protein [Trichinella spiralis]